MFEDKRHEVLQELEPFHTMWDGRLSVMSNTSHDIDLVADAKPFQSVPYRAGTLMRDIEKVEVDKLG